MANTINWLCFGVLLILLQDVVSYTSISINGFDENNIPYGYNSISNLNADDISGFQPIPWQGSGRYNNEILRRDLPIPMVYADKIMEDCYNKIFLEHSPQMFRESGYINPYRRNLKNNITPKPTKNIIYIDFRDKNIPPETARKYLKGTKFKTPSEVSNGDNENNPYNNADTRNTGSNQLESTYNPPSQQIGSQQGNGYYQRGGSKVQENPWTNNGNEGGESNVQQNRRKSTNGQDNMAGMPKNAQVELIQFITDIINKNEMNDLSPDLMEFIKTYPSNKKEDLFKNIFQQNGISSTQLVNPQIISELLNVLIHNQTDKFITDISTPLLQLMLQLTGTQNLETTLPNGINMKQPHLMQTFLKLMKENGGKIIPEDLRAWILNSPNGQKIIEFLQIPGDIQCTEKEYGLVQCMKFFNFKKGAKNL